MVLVSDPKNWVKVGRAGPLKDLDNNHLDTRRRNPINTKEVQKHKNIVGVIGSVGPPSRTKPSEEGRASKEECVSMKVDLGPLLESLN